MASLETAAGGYYKLKTILNGKRKAIYLGRMSKRNAQTIKINIEQLQSSVVAGVAIAPMQAQWLSDIAGTKLHDRLVELGLAKQAEMPVSDITLVDFWCNYVEDLAIGESTQRLSAVAVSPLLKLLLRLFITLTIAQVGLLETPLG